MPALARTEWAEALETLKSDIAATVAVALQTFTETTGATVVGVDLVIGDEDAPPDGVVVVVPVGSRKRQALAEWMTS